MRTRNEHDYSPERGRYRSSVATRAASAGALSGRARSGRNCKRSRGRMAAGDWRRARARRRRSFEPCARETSTTTRPSADAIDRRLQHAPRRQARWMGEREAVATAKGRARENGGRRRAATDARDRRRRTQRACRAQRSRSPARQRPAGGARGASRVTRRSFPAVRDRSARCLPSCPARCPCSAATPTRRRAHGAPRRRRSRRD